MRHDPSREAAGADRDTPIGCLTRALNDVADALASADLPGLLAAESRLGAAFDSLTPAGADRPSLEAARGALLRCRRLGASLVTFTRLSLDPQGLQAYSRCGAVAGGAALAVPARGREMDLRG